MSRTDQVYIPIRETGRGRAGQQPSPTHSTPASRLQPPTSSQQGGPSRGGTRGPTGGNGAQYLLRLESPQKTRSKRPSLFDGQPSDDEGDAGPPRMSERQAGRNVRPVRRVENESPSSVLSSFAANIRASQDELTELNRTIDEKRRELQAAQASATEAVSGIGKLSHAVKDGENDERAQAEAFLLLEDSISASASNTDSLSNLVEELVQARSAVGDALSSGMEDMQALEDRLAADVEQKAEELEALSREQELAIHKLTEDLAAMTNELEDCEQQRQALELRNDHAAQHIEQVEEKIVQRDTGLKAVEERRSEVESQLAALLARIQDEDKRAAQISQDDARIMSRAHEEAKAIDSEIESQSKKNEQARSRLEADKRRAAAHEQTLATYHAKIGETKALIADTERTILETVRVIEAVEQETRLVETQNTTLAESITGLEREESAKKAELERLETERRELVDKYDSVRRQREVAEQELKPLRSSLEARVQGIKQRLAVELSDAEVAKSKQEHQAEEAADHVNELEGAMVSLAQEIATIEDDIKRLVDEKHTSEEAQQTHKEETERQVASLSEEVDAVRRKLNEVQTLHGQLQTKCADAKTKLDDLNKTRLAQLDGLAGIKAQIKDMNEGKGLTEADQVWIEENAQQRLLAESAEADATHQAEVQQLQSDIEKIKEKTAALVTTKMAELDARQTALEASREDGRRRLDEVKRLISEAQVRRQKREAEAAAAAAAAAAEAAQRQREREAAAAAEAAKLQREREEAEAAEAAVRLRREEKEAARRKQQEQAARKKQKEQEAARKSTKRATGARRSREVQAEEPDDTADAENMPPLGSQESRPHKNRSRRSTRAHHAGNEPDEEEADKTKDRTKGATQVLRMEDWDEVQPDDDEGECQVPEVNTARMQARLSPRRSPPVQEPRRQDEHDSSLSREASAAFEDTPAGWEREGRDHPPLGQQPPRRPLPNKSRRHSLPNTSAAPSHSHDTDEPFGLSPRILIPDDSMAARSAWPGPPPAPARTNTGNIRTTGQGQQGPPPAGRAQQRSLPEARAAKDKIYGTKRSSTTGRPRSVSVSTSRITIEETRTTYENPVTVRQDPPAKKPSKKPLAGRGRSSSVTQGDEWFADDHYDF